MKVTTWGAAIYGQDRSMPALTPANLLRNHEMRNARRFDTFRTSALLYEYGLEEKREV